MTETVTLWRPTGPVELGLVEHSGWKRWPPRLPDQPVFYPVTTRAYAIRITREWNVPEKGVGYVTSFDVRREFLDPYEVRTVGGQECREYWIPAGDLDEFNRNLVGGIRPVLEYRGPVPDAEFDAAERRMMRTFPKPWREHLQRRSWLKCGWLSDDCYLSLHLPADSTRVAGAWEPSTTSHPGIVFLGDDGSGEHLAVDSRKSDPPIVAVPNVSGGWSDAIEQASTVAEFISRVEDDSFVFKL